MGVIWGDYIPHGKTSQARWWASGAPNSLFSVPRPRGHQQQRAAAAGALAPPPPQHPRLGAGNGHLAHVRAQPQRVRALAWLPRGTLVSECCGHCHLYPSAVLRLIFERQVGNLNFSSLASLCGGEAESHVTLEPPISTSPFSSPDRDGLGSPPAPGHLTPPGSSPPACRTNGTGHPVKGLLGDGWRQTVGGECPEVQVKDKCWHWHPWCMNQQPSWGAGPPRVLARAPATPWDVPINAQVVMVPH